MVYIILEVSRVSVIEIRMRERERERDREREREREKQREIVTQRNNHGIYHP